MCGIAGILAQMHNGPAEDEAVRRMCDLMIHRGPDDSGLLVDGPMALGHRRLSVIDLRPEAAQPMTNEDGAIALIINGEIYNFRELRSELEAAGHKFRSRSDSEVVLHLYEERGLDFLDRLRGMFALALWDSRQQKLILARDRFGKKPLFYYVGRQGIVFASELQSMARAKVIPREPDLDAIDAYLALQYVPTPFTIYKGVRKLPPGHRLVCKPG
ncbi:asparagine synthetase B family protein, partial [Thermodesulfobacteriota bacterium]